MLSYTMSYLSQHQKDIVGALGGIFMAICLIPQLAHMYTSKSARDLSYAWTAWYIIGLSFTGAYLFLEGATVGWISTVVEVSLAWVVVFGKAYLDAAYGSRSIEEDISHHLPPQVAVTDADSSTAFSKPVLQRVSGAVPLLAKAPAQHGGCHVFLDYTIDDRDKLPNDRELSQKVLSVLDEAVAEAGSSRLRFKHVEYVSPDDHEPDQSEGFSLIAISGQGHITAEWFAVHSLLSIGMLTTSSEDLAANARRLGLIIHKKLTSQFASLIFVKASTQLIAELQS